MAAYTCARRSVACLQGEASSPNDVHVRGEGIRGVASSRAHVSIADSAGLAGFHSHPSLIVAASLFYRSRHPY